ncbi:MAG: hypothetical protein ACLS3M_04705 [Collinsella sp.]
MSIFDKGFDPLQEIQRATETAGEATARIAEGGIWGGGGRRCDRGRGYNGGRGNRRAAGGAKRRPRRKEAEETSTRRRRSTHQGAGSPEGD